MTTGPHAEAQGDFVRLIQSHAEPCNAGQESIDTCSCEETLVTYDYTKGRQGAKGTDSAQLAQTRFRADILSTPGQG